MNRCGGVRVSVAASAHTSHPGSFLLASGPSILHFLLFSKQSLRTMVPQKGFEVSLQHGGFCNSSEEAQGTWASFYQSILLPQRDLPEENSGCRTRKSSHPVAEMLRAGVRACSRRACVLAKAKREPCHLQASSILGVLVFICLHCFLLRLG